MGLYSGHGYFQKLYIHLVAGGAAQAGTTLARHRDWLLLPGDVPAILYGIGHPRTWARGLYWMDFISAAVGHYFDMVGPPVRTLYCSPLFLSKLR